MQWKLSNILLPTWVVVATLMAAPNAQAEPSDTWVDAGVTTQGATYLFQGSQYLRFNNAQLDPGYPRPLAGGGWRGLPRGFQDGIDAALYAADRAKTYFFKGNQYVRLTGVTVDPGYPRALPGGWQGLPAEFHSGIDAALFSAGHIYFFKGARYVRFTGSQLDPGYPADLPGGWELPADLRQVDAALSFGGKNYFFSGANYLRLSGNRRDAGYPAQLPGGWAGLAPPGSAGSLAGPETKPGQQAPLTTCPEPASTNTLRVRVLSRQDSESVEGEPEFEPFAGAKVEVQRGNNSWETDTATDGFASFDLPQGGPLVVKVFNETLSVDLLSNCIHLVVFTVIRGGDPCSVAEKESESCWTPALYDGLSDCGSAHSNLIATCYDNAERNQQEGFEDAGNFEACRDWSIAQYDKCIAEIQSAARTCRQTILENAGCSAQIRYIGEP